MKNGYMPSLLDCTILCKSEEEKEDANGTQLLLRPGLCDKSGVPFSFFSYGLIAATRRVAAQGPAAYQKRTPSDRRSVIFSPQAARKKTGTSYKTASPFHRSPSDSPSNLAELDPELDSLRIVDAEHG